MTYKNHIKNRIKNLFDIWLDMLSIETKLTDDQMECMQFGICNYAPRRVEEVPFYHY